MWFEICIIITLYTDGIEIVVWMNYSYVDLMDLKMEYKKSQPFYFETI